MIAEAVVRPRGPDEEPCSFWKEEWASNVAYVHEEALKSLELAKKGQSIAEAEVQRHYDDPSYMHAAWERWDGYVKTVEELKAELAVHESHVACELLHDDSLDLCCRCKYCVRFGFDVNLSNNREVQDFLARHS